MLPLEDVSLNFVETQDDVAAFFRWLGERRSVLACDTETTGLRYWRPDFRVRLVQFGDLDTGWIFRADRFGAAIEDTITQYEGQWTGHNFAAHDYHALTNAGFSFPDKRRVDDTLIMSKLAQANQFGHGLKENAVKHFGQAAGIGQSLLHEAFALHGLREDSRDHNESERAWSTIPYLCEAYSVYSGLDTIISARLWEKLNPIIQKDYAEAYAREMASWFVTVSHEHRGLRVDLDYTNKLLDEMDQDIQIVRSQLAELGVPNPGARQKLAQKLLDEGWVPKEFSKKSGKPKLDKAVLEGLDNEVVAPLLEWSRLTKWRTAYVVAVLDRSHNGRVYPSINHFGAKTGRQSMFGPPIHQMPSRHPDAHKIRRMFLPEEGDAAVSIDYAAEEDRLSTHFSDDKAMREIFNKGLKKHRYTAAGVYQIPYESVTEEQYGLIKGFSYASAYGAQDPKLAKMLGIAVGEVAAIRERTSGVYAEFAEYVAKLEEMGRQQFRAEGAAYATTIGGRRVYADQGKWGEPKYYQLVNYINQGSGADILKEAQNRIAAAGLSHHLMFELHDEVLITVPKGPEGDEIAREIGQLMTFKEGDTVFGAPLTIDMPTAVGEQCDWWGTH